LRLENNPWTTRGRRPAVRSPNRVVQGEVGQDRAPAVISEAVGGLQEAAASARAGAFLGAACSLQHGGLQRAARDWGGLQRVRRCTPGADCSARRPAEGRERWPNNVWRRVRHLGLGGGGSCLAVLFYFSLTVR
jgi:hypothetical protein